MYPDRLIITVESDYFENRELTFSIQEYGEGGQELTIYLPDVEQFIKHNSSLDMRCRSLKMSYNLPKNEYSMLPHYAYKALHFAVGQDRVAIAVTIPLDNENAPVSFTRVPEVEKCIIQTKSRLSY